MELPALERTSAAPMRLGTPLRAVWPDTLPHELPEALVPGWALFVSSSAANEGAVNLFVVYTM